MGQKLRLNIVKSVRKESCIMKYMESEIECEMGRGFNRKSGEDPFHLPRMIQFPWGFFVCFVFN